MPPSADVNWAQIVRFPATHPHYKEYERRCLEARLQPAFIQDSWELIIRGPQGALWDTISARYVEVAASCRDTMHVFMRTHDLESTFYGEELVNWRKAKRKKNSEPDGLTYHVLVGMDSFNVEKVFVRERDAKAFLLTFLGQVQTRFEKNMLEQGVNHRYRSEVWRDNERAYRDTLAKKTYESYREYMEHPLREIVEQFCEAEQAISPDKDFDPKKFSSVMDELLLATKPRREE